MNRFKNQLIVVAAFTLLAVIGTIMNSRQVEAQGPPNGLAVNIVNPIPVPVTGSTTVSGTVAITGQPLGVNVNNSPTVSLTAGTTVLTKNVDEPGASTIPGESEHGRGYGPTYLYILPRAAQQTPGH
jgi:hypothetical protein